MTGERKIGQWQGKNNRIEEMWKEGERGEEMERKEKKDLLWKNCKRFCNSRSRVKYEDGEKCED